MCRSIPRSCGRINTRLPLSAPCGRTAPGPLSTQGALSNDKNPGCCRDEPGDHALGRSRGGLSTKIHAAVDGRGRPLVILLTPGQAGDAPMMLPVLAALRVERPLGRPRNRPDRVLADKAYSSRAIRIHLRSRGITSVIPEPDDQKSHRQRRGTRGGRPVTYDRTAYRGRNVIERAFNDIKRWRGLGHPIRQTRHHLPRRARPRRSTPMAQRLGRHVLADYM
jgi:transposase